MNAFIDLTGRRFGRWLVLKRLSGRYWKCHCDCGTEKHVYASSLVSGKSFSCGCFDAEIARQTCKRFQGGPGNYGLTRKHGEAIERTLEYRTWISMRERCRNIDRAYYGARGINVCARWMSYENFLADMGRRPSPKHSLDRIDNDKGYGPENCRWATKKQQVDNRRRFGRIEKFTDTELESEWMRRQSFIPLSLPT